MLIALPRIFIHCSSPGLIDATALDMLIALPRTAYSTKSRLQETSLKIATQPSTAYIETAAETPK